MSLILYLKAFGVWIIFLIFFIINGSARQFLYEPKIGVLRAHQVSSVIGISFIFLFTYFFISRIKFEFSRTDLLMLGVFWLVLTVMFEFVFGHYVMGHPWSNLFADYNIFKGRLWSLVLIATFLAPYIAGLFYYKK